MRELNKRVKVLALFLWMLFGREVPDQQPTRMEEERSIDVPWQLVCNFMVRVVDGPGDSSVAVVKRDCPK